MKLVITIESGNVAVESAGEVAELVQNVAERIIAGAGAGRITDWNGNAVGEFTYAR